MVSELMKLKSTSEIFQREKRKRARIEPWRTPKVNGFNLEENPAKEIEKEQSNR